MYMRRDTNVSEKEVYKREITRMNKVIRRIVMAAIVVGLLSGMCLVAEAATNDVINYKDATGNTKSCTDYTVVSSGTSWDEGWYAVTDDTSISGMITIQGNVNLILCDGATLTMEQIEISYGNLNIDEGSTADSIIGSGAMALYAPTANAIHQVDGSLNIYGGRINATSGEQSAIRATSGSF